MFDQATTRIDAKYRVDPETILSFGLVATMLLAAEVLMLARRGNTGLVLHALTVVALIAFVYHFDGRITLLFQSLILLPILRIFNLGIPPFTENPLVFLGVIYVCIFASTWMIVRSQDLTLGDIGLTLRDTRLLIPGALIGLALGIVQFLLELESLQYAPTTTNYLLVILTTGILVGLVEELIFRGLVQRRATDLFGRWPSIVSVSVLFGFMHSVWLSPLNIVFAVTVSLFLGWVYAVTRNMWFITGVHAMINISVFLLAPLYLHDLVAIVSTFV